MSSLARRVVVVDDEPDLRSLLGDYLGLHGFAVRCAADAAALFRHLESAPADAILLDIAMPGASGLEALAELRRRGATAGILLLTASDAEEDRIRGLLAGADDYITKPFAPREVLARLRAVLRRTPDHHTPPSGNPVSIGLCLYDPASRSLTGPNGAPIALTAREADLIDVFLRHPGQILSRDRLQALLHGENSDSNGRGMDIRLMRLRQKVEVNPSEPTLFCTVRGEGYVYRPQKG